MKFTFVRSLSSSPRFLFRRHGLEDIKSHKLPQLAPFRTVPKKVGAFRCDPSLINIFGCLARAEHPPREVLEVTHSNLQVPPWLALLTGQLERAS